MKRLAATIWSNYKIEAILLFLGLVLAGILIYFTVPGILFYDQEFSFGKKGQ